ncbi:MAG: M20/M25/M40 family metallo-hydrolase [bacterium]|nr:M20/M25/M40 family metallo-hydrolase [bacterium]
MKITIRHLCLVGLVCGCTVARTNAADDTALARVEMTAAVQTNGLAVHELLQDAQGRDYALVLAPVAALRTSGCAFQVLATNAAPHAWVVARTRRPATHAQLAQLPECVYDDGRHLILRRSPAFMARRADYHAIVRPVPPAPMRWDAPARAARSTTTFTCTFDPAIATMISQVSSSRIWRLIAQLSGEANFTVGAATYSMFSRHTDYGSPFQKDAAFIFQTMTNLQYQTRYFRWSADGYVSSNVIATKTGTTHSNEIVLLLAHLDNINDDDESGRTPGADDNASGCTALLLAAEQLGPHVFERTLQLVFVTGEEQDLYGSAAYAAAMAAQSATIVAVYNFDVIAYSTIAAPVVGVHTHVKSSPRFAADLPLAQLYTNVMATYHVTGVTPSIVADSEPYSDHASFWDEGYPAVLTIENYDDYNDDYCHTGDDKIQYCNIAYCTTVVKGGIGTVAHAAQLVPEPCSVLSALCICIFWRARAY